MAILRYFMQDWERRLTVILTALLLLQYMYWIEEEQFWLPDTLYLVKTTILVTVLIQLILRMPLILNVMLQAVIIGSLHFMYIPSYSMTERGAFSADGFVQLLQLNVMQLAPYIYFSLTAWLLYGFALWAMRVKWRIYTIMIVTVLCFSIRDSFSLLVLWEQVAMTLFCGLSILVIQHMGEIKRKNPEGWAYFSEYPFSFAGPTIILVCSSVLMGTFAPEIRPLLPDPYSLWKSFKGETVVTSGKGFVEEGTGSTLLDNVTSGYSRNDANLGGNFEFDYSPVMTVESSHRGYWRGETRSLYTGKGWEQTDSEQRASSTPVRANTLLAKDTSINRSKLKTMEVTQTVTMSNNTAYPALFGAAEMSMVTQLASSSSNEFSFAQWTPRQGELRWDEQAGKYPATYTIISQMPVIDEAGLRTAATTLPNGAQVEEYLQVSNTVPNRVKQLARDITENATNAYDKVKLLENYLGSTFPYTNKPNLSKGRSPDFVDRFLFEIQEGYCDYYSSAMVVMTRSLGIPARWVKGYTSGSSAFDPETIGIPYEDLDLNGAGVYTVVNADAHSWVEVYFDGWGWIPFEPTAGFSLPSVLPDNAVEELPEVNFNTTAAEPEATEQRLGSTVWIAAAIAGTAILLFYIIRLRRFPIMQWLAAQTRLPVALSLNQKVIYEFEKLVRYARRRGYQRLEHETVRETTQKWIAQKHWLKSDLEALLVYFEKAKYSKDCLTEEDIHQVMHVAQRVRQTMR